MTDTKHSAFEAWLDEPHPADASMTRRDYMPKNDGGFAAMAWQAATAQGKRQPLSDGDAKDADRLTDLDLENLRIGRALQRAAGDMPDWFEIQISVEQGAASAEWIDTDGVGTDIDGGGEPLSVQINMAIDAAIASQKGSQ